MIYQIEITPTALASLNAISDRRVQSVLARRIDALAHGPEQQGKKLRGDLSSFYSVRAVGQRYRVLYRVDSRGRKVVVYLVGIRKAGSRTDAYELAQRLARRGWL